MQSNQSGETTTLYRPVGQAELELIEESGFRGFPWRLPTQPIFYPVLNEEYATQIARDWNARDPGSGYAGYVTRFRVRTAFLSRYSVHTVGGATHKEYWIPAGELTEFNRNIVGEIEVIAAYRAPSDGAGGDGPVRPSSDGSARLTGSESAD